MVDRLCMADVTSITLEKNNFKILKNYVENYNKNCLILSMKGYEILNDNEILYKGVYVRSAK